MWSQEDQKFKIIPSYLESLRLLSYRDPPIFYKETSTINKPSRGPSEEQGGWVSGTGDQQDSSAIELYIRGQSEMIELL